MYSILPVSRSQSYTSLTSTLVSRAITPPPLQSHPWISALHTGHLVSFGFPAPATARSLALFKAGHRHDPHMTCPQSVSTGLRMGQKHIGQACSDMGVCPAGGGGGVGRCGIGGTEGWMGLGV